MTASWSYGPDGEHGSAVLEVTYFDKGRKSVVYTEMKTSFSFCDKMNALLACDFIGNQSGQYSGSSHIGLVATLPTIWMAENEFDAILDGTPEGSRARVSL